MDLSEKLSAFFEQLPTPQLLVVDDDPTIREALDTLLVEEGYKVQLVADGKSALEALANDDYTLIICDQKLPDMAGVDVLAEAATLRPDVGRVMITGHGDYQLAVESINRAQICQFVRKPWQADELTEVIGELVDRHVIAREARNLHRIQTSQHRELSEAHQGMSEEMKMGGRVHEVLLRANAPASAEGLEIGVLTIPSRVVDGDFNDFYQPTDAILDMVFGDVMGKGLPAALVGTAMKAQLMRFALPMTRRRLFRKGASWSEDVLPIEQIVTRLHNELSTKFINLGVFSTLFYARFSPQQSAMRFVDCGSTKPIHYKSQNHTVEEISGDSFPIGFVPDDTFRAKIVCFEPGDFFLFYSDGMSEAKNRDGELYGTERIHERLLKCAHKSAQEIVDDLYAQMQGYSESPLPEDDLTLICVKITKRVPFNVKGMCGIFNSDLEQLPQVREFVARTVSEAPEHQHVLIPQLQLAVNEAFCNVVKHACKGESGHRIELHCGLSLEGITFELRDPGESFDPTSTLPPDLSGAKYSGFGMYMIQQIADELTYTPKDDKAARPYNSLKIHKQYPINEVNMNLDHTCEGDTLIVCLNSEQLDARITTEFKEQVSGIISNGSHTQVVFDLKQLQFIDSSGLGGLLSVLRDVNSKGGDLRLANMTPPVRTMFEIVRMHKLFEIFPTVEAAVASFTGRKSGAQA